MIQTIPSAVSQQSALSALSGVHNTMPVQAAVTSTPQNVDQLLRQVQISGTVSSVTPDGNLTLNTAIGNFSFSLAQLPEDIKAQLQQELENLVQTDKPITVTIQPGSPPTQAVLLLPSGSSAAQTATAPTNVPQPAVLQGQPLTVSAGMGLSAVVLPPDIIVPGAAAATTGAAQASMQAASNDAAEASPAFPAVSASVAAPISGAAAVAPTEEAAGAVPAAAQAAANPAAPALQLEPGKEVVLRIDAVSLPSAATPAPSAPGQIAATVIGSGANSQLIIKSGDTVFYVRSPASAPVGANLLISIEEQRQLKPTLLPQEQPLNFDSLRDILQTLTQANPQLAQQFAQSSIPQPNVQLSAPLLFFLSALKQGDTKGWFGEDVRDAMMKIGKLGLLTQFNEQMKDASRTSVDPNVGEWKSYPVPMQHNGQFQVLTFHVHQDGHGATQLGSAATPGQIRFLIDVRMSRLGQLQLDGLVRPQKLDMIIRSESALPPGLPQELRDTYIRTIEALGQTGSLSFQIGRQGWLEPQDFSRQSTLL